MRQPVQVLVYAYTVVDGTARFLLLRRVATLIGFWQGVTGGVEDDEEVLATAQRELWEETGFTATEIVPVHYSYSYPVADRFRYLYAEGTETITEFVFAARMDREETPVIDPREHDEWAWLGFDEALGRLTWATNIEALRRCLALIEGRVPSP
jgi:dATP pyrophosphohydrolase